MKKLHTKKHLKSWLVAAALVVLIAFSAAVLASCAPKEGTDSFHYLMEEFADLKIIRSRITGWE